VHWKCPLASHVHEFVQPLASPPPQPSPALQASPSMAHGAGGDGGGGRGPASIGVPGGQGNVSVHTPLTTTYVAPTPCPSGHTLAIAGIGSFEQSGPFGAGPELVPPPVPAPELDPLPMVGGPLGLEPDGGEEVAPLSAPGAATDPDGLGGGVLAPPVEPIVVPVPPVPPPAPVPPPFAALPPFAVPPPFAPEPGSPDAAAPLLLPPAFGLGRSGVGAPEQARALRFPTTRTTCVNRMSLCKSKHRARALVILCGDFREDERVPP
jgi:hypothetical protein